jgi:uncharacterized paraquat-inducible protein A
VYTVPLHAVNSIVFLPTFSVERLFDYEAGTKTYVWESRRGILNIRYAVAWQAFLMEFSIGLQHFGFIMTHIHIRPSFLEMSTLTSQVIKTLGCAKTDGRLGIPQVIRYGKDSTKERDGMSHLKGSLSRANQREGMCRRCKPRLSHSQRSRAS